MSPSERARAYQRALDYLRRCGTLDYSKLLEMNRLAGSVFSDADLRGFVQKSKVILPFGGRSGGMEAIKEELCETLMEGIVTFGALGAALGGGAGTSTSSIVFGIAVVLVGVLAVYWFFIS